MSPNRDGGVMPPGSVRHMDRERMARAGIHLPVLPTVVFGALPGAPDWAGRLLALGVDVLSSGADPDTDETLAAALAAAPFKPVKAVGTGATLATGPWLVEGSDAQGNGIPINLECAVFAQDGFEHRDQNDLAASLLPIVHDDPADWWVVARGLATCTAQEAQAAIAVLVEGTKLVRLYLTKRQFEV